MSIVTPRKIDLVDAVLTTRLVVFAVLTALAVFAIPAFASAATMSLSPSAGTFSAGATFEVKILLDTAGASTSGTDAYVRFDPNVLQAVDANSAATGTQVLPGSLYSQTSYNQVDNSTGKISFSGSKSAGSAGYSGSGTLATITFSAVKAASSTDVTFDYSSGGSLTDSNVIVNDNDVITGVTNGKYVISAAAATTTDTSTTAGTGTSTGATTGTTTTGTGASGASGTDGSGGTATVAASGIDLEFYMIATIVALIGSLFFITKRV